MYKPPDSVPEVKNDNPFPDEPTVENNPWMLEPSFNEHFEQLRYWEMAYGEWYDTCYLDGTLRMSVTFITMRDRLVTFSLDLTHPCSTFSVMFNAVCSFFYLSAIQMIEPGRREKRLTSYSPSTAPLGAFFSSLAKCIQV